MIDEIGIVSPGDVDIRIFGVPERIENINKTKMALSVPDENIIIDYNHDGVLTTARKAWLKDTDRRFVLVLQDDIELCKDFMKYCCQILTVHPNEIIGLCSMIQRRHVRKVQTVSPYVSIGFVAAPAIVMPTDYVKPCVESWEDSALGDDMNIIKWAKENNITMLTIIPSIVQHIGFQSVFNPERNLGGTDFYSDDPSDINWSNGFVTPFTNICRR